MQALKSPKTKQKRPPLLLEFEKSQGCMQIKAGEYYTEHRTKSFHSLKSPKAELRWLYLFF